MNVKHQDVQGEGYCSNVKRICLSKPRGGIFRKAGFIMDAHKGRKMAVLLDIPLAYLHARMNTRKVGKLFSNYRTKLWTK